MPFWLKQIIPLKNEKKNIFWLPDTQSTEINHSIRAFLLYIIQFKWEVYMCYWANSTIHHNIKHISWEINSFDEKEKHHFNFSLAWNEMQVNFIFFFVYHNNKEESAACIQALLLFVETSTYANHHHFWTFFFTFVGKILLSLTLCGTELKRKKNI